MRLPLEKWDTFMPNRPFFSIDVFTNIFKSNGPTGGGPDGPRNITTRARPVRAVFLSRVCEQ